MNDRGIPSANDLMRPTLQALVKRGGSASIQEILEAIAEIMGIPDDILEIPHGKGRQSEIAYRAGLARIRLKKLQAVDSRKPGIWSITDHGRSLDSEERVRGEYEERIAAQRNMNDRRIPMETDLMWPTLQTLVNRGGSASNQEILEEIAEIMAIPDEILEITHGRGQQSEVACRALGAMGRLWFLGAVETRKPGIWSITDHGRSLDSEVQVKGEDTERIVDILRRMNDRKNAIEGIDNQSSNDDNLESEEWESVLLRILKNMNPMAFGRLCQKLLIESGFTKMEITDQTGDRGIDGVGVLRVSFLSFHVLYQCRRYDRAVRAREIRDFRGAMIGRADKGVFLTTGHFTKDAEREAIRDGAPVIDLIDGMELCRLIKSLGLGVETRMLEEVVVREEFFESI